MSLLPDELRLAIAIVVNVFVWIAAYRFARRMTGRDRIASSLDAMLLHYLVQYISVCLPGILGVLGAESMLLTATLIAAAMWWISPKIQTLPTIETSDSIESSRLKKDRADKSPLFTKRAEGGTAQSTKRGSGESPSLTKIGSGESPSLTKIGSGESPSLTKSGANEARPLTKLSNTPSPNPRRNLSGETPPSHSESVIFVGSLLFVIGYFAGLIWTQAGVPFVGDDALTYHLPAAGYWLQTGRIGLYNTWFFNPANTYSPLAGSAFLTWLIAPIRADVIAQFAQMPAMILAFLAIVQIARAVGVRTSVAALVAAGALLSRPFISEAILIKDDHFLAAFFVAAVAGCAAESLKDRLGPWRIGIALGLFFATKYTALLTAPILLLALDAPILALDAPLRALTAPQRARWKSRQWLAALACVIAIAAPWYARNWMLTGNPLYPVPVRLGSWNLFPCMFIPQRSTEMRTVAGAWNAMTHAYSSFSPTLACTLLIAWLASIALSAKLAIRQPLLRLCLAGPLVGLAIFFLFSHAALIRYAYPSLLLLFVCGGLLISRLGFPRWAELCAAGALCAMSIWGGFVSKEILRGLVSSAAIFCLIGCASMFTPLRVWQNLRVRLAVGSAIACILGGWIFISWHAFIVQARADGFDATEPQYQADAPMWRYVQDHVPPASSLAYTNLVFTRPLMGFDYSRQVFYIPTRPGVRNYADLPHSATPVTDQDIRQFVANLLTDQADQKPWLDHLLQSNAEYLLVGKQSILASPPEDAFIRESSEHFRAEFSNEAGTLYHILR